MFIKRLNYLKYILLIFLLAVLLFTSISCERPDYTEEKAGLNSEYIKYTQCKGIALFSFEYPNNYDRGFERIVSDHVYISRSRWQNDGWLDSSFQIRVGWNDFTNATSLLEENMQFGLNSEDDYQVIERSSVFIDDLKGEILVSSYTPLFTQDSDLKESSLLINRGVYFDYAGYIWHIRMISIEEVAEADKAVWEHLIETFEILD